MQRDDDTSEERPTLRPVPMAKLPAGQQFLPVRWCEEAVPGTNFLAPHLAQTLRASVRRTGRMKHNPDTAAQNAERRWAGYCWERAGLLDRYFGRSDTIH